VLDNERLFVLYFEIKAFSAPGVMFFLFHHGLFEEFG